MDIETWLNDMTTQPLPGGVAASALAASMGAALIAKALRITLEREPFEGTERQALVGALEQARDRQAEFRRLAESDMEAYRAVIATRSLAAGHPARRQAWHAATNTPLALAEGARRLLAVLAGVQCQCWPGVCVDYQIGAELLQSAVQSGRLAAAANLDDWGQAEAALPFRERLAALDAQPGETTERSGADR